MNAAATAIIKALEGNSHTGMCRCPAHDDHTPSLHVGAGRDGKPLVKCHAGCTQEAVIAALKLRGIWPQAGQRLRPSPIKAQEDSPEDEYRRWREAWAIIYAARKARAGQPDDYLKARGISAVPACAMILPATDSRRLLGKNFPAMVCPVIDGSTLLGVHVTWLTRDGKGKCATEKPRRLYGKTKGGYVQLSKIEPGKPLIVGEGIETTLSAMQLANLPGIAALSASNMSAVKVPKCDPVFIAADHDEAGRKAAAQLASRLKYEGREVRIALPAGEGTDWNDRLRDGQEDQIRDEWCAALQAGDPEAATDPISALDEGAFMELTFPKRELLLAPWLPRPGLVMLHAPRGEGKTWLALAVGKAIAAGEDLLGWHCSGPARVLYADGELPGAFLQARLANFPPSPHGFLHVLCRDTFLLRRQLMPDLGTLEGRAALDAIIEQCRPDVVILDSISTLVRSGIENEAESWAPVQQWLLDHRWKGRTMILVHHENKSGKQRGTSKREDVLDTVIGLKKLPEESTATESVFDLTFTKSRDFWGDDAAQMRIRLSARDGQVTWQHQTVRDAQLDRVRELLAAGAQQKDIAKELGVTPARVSQLVKRVKEFDAAQRERD